MVSPTSFNLSLNLARISWFEPQSAPSLVFADYVSFSILGCKKYNQSHFGVDHLMMSMCRVFSCVVGRGCLQWPVCSISLCPASFCAPRPNLPVTPGVSWLPTFAFQSPIMKRASFLGASSRCPQGKHWCSPEDSYLCLELLPSSKPTLLVIPSGRKDHFCPLCEFKLLPAGEQSR